jgi:hypothetical protein
MKGSAKRAWTSGSFQSLRTSKVVLPQLSLSQRHSIKAPWVHSYTSKALTHEDQNSRIFIDLTAPRAHGNSLPHYYNMDAREP